MTDEIADKLAALRPGYLKRLADRHAVLSATTAAMTDGRKAR